jgi:hypothetical protein
VLNDQCKIEARKSGVSVGSRSYGKEAWRKGNSPKLALFERRHVGRGENIFPTVAETCGELLANYIFLCF